MVKLLKVKGSDTSCNSDKILTKLSLVIWLCHMAPLSQSSNVSKRGFYSKLFLLHYVTNVLLLTRETDCFCYMTTHRVLPIYFLLISCTCFFSLPTDQVTQPLLIPIISLLYFLFRDYFHLAAWCVGHARAWLSDTISLANIIRAKSQWGVVDRLELLVVYCISLKGYSDVWWFQKMRVYQSMFECFY